jgi:hypothetical protein
MRAITHHHGRSDASRREAPYCQHAACSLGQARENQSLPHSEMGRARIGRRWVKLLERTSQILATLGHSLRFGPASLRERVKDTNATCFYGEDNVRPQNFGHPAPVRHIGATPLATSTGPGSFSEGSLRVANGSRPAPLPQSTLRHMLRSCPSTKASPNGSET